MYYNFLNILINNGFEINNTYQNIYIHLFEALKNAILNKSIDPHTKLPPSRVLAKDLNTSRSTVVKAYNLLVLEKYVTSIKGSGHYVEPSKNKKIHQLIGSNQVKGSLPQISKKAKAFNKNIHLINNSSNSGIAFRPGLPPLDAFPVDKWKNILNEYWKGVRPSQLSYSDTIGLQSLRDNISNYLKIYRNINCDSNQIIITSGSLHSLYLIASALIDKEDQVVVENPTYPHAFSLFDSFGAKIKPVSVDKEGLIVKKIKSKDPKFIYTTPSNQYPLGVKMSLKRRNELLNWASLKNTFIIEDDYDHEFSNWEKPISSIYSLDNQERVIYLGTFNKLLHPSIRLGYMIVPNYLLDSIISLYQQSSRFISPSLQWTMSSFIEKDYLNKHLRNVINTSKERKEIFVTHFNKYFQGKIKLNLETNSLHIVGHLNKDQNDLFLSKSILAKGVITHPLSNYYIKGKKENGLVMGYASVNNKVIKDTLRKLYNFYSEIAK